MIKGNVKRAYDLFNQAVAGIEALDALEEMRRQGDTAAMNFLEALKTMKGLPS